MFFLSRLTLQFELREPWEVVTQEIELELRWYLMNQQRWWPEPEELKQQQEMVFVPVAYPLPSASIDQRKTLSLMESLYLAKLECCLEVDYLGKHSPVVH